MTRLKQHSTTDMWETKEVHKGPLMDLVMREKFSRDVNPGLPEETAC